MNKKNKKNTVRNLIVVVLTTILMAGMTIVPAMADDTVVSAAAETESITSSTAETADSETVSAESQPITQGDPDAVTSTPDDDPAEAALERGETLPPKMIVVYRVYNPNSGEHLYTGSSDEVQDLVAKGWHNEGTAWSFLQAGRQPVVPICRFYNPNSGEHFYANWDSNEISSLLNSGWNEEGVVGYAPTVSEFSQKVSDTTTITVFSDPVYRLCNPNCTGAGAHHYTTDAAERDHLVSLGWRYEGVAWNGVQGMVA